MNEILQQRIEEAAEKHAKRRFNTRLLYDLYGEQSKRDFLEGEEHALQNQWVSVEEALPEENGWYLTLNTKSTSPNFADTCQWNAKGKYWYTELCGDVFLHERTHWMEIPSLKGGEK